MNGMGEVTARIVWVAILSCSFAYVFYLLFGGLFIAPPKPQHVVIRDALAAGEHVVSGMVMVPTPCDELTVRTGILSPTIYTLELTTWQDPSITCPQNETPRSFSTVTFAPAFGVQFIVFLDGKTVPFDVTQVILDKSQ
jgi:hypothetical protein